MWEEKGKRYWCVILFVSKYSWLVLIYFNNIMTFMSKQQKLVKCKLMRAMMRRNLSKQKKRTNAAFIEINVNEDRKKPQAKHESILNGMEEREKTIIFFTMLFYWWRNSIWDCCIWLWTWRRITRSNVDWNGTEEEDASHLEELKMHIWFGSSFFLQLSSMCIYPCRV